MAAAGASYSTIERRKSAVAKLVDAESTTAGQVVEDPTKHQRVALALKAIRQTRGGLPVKAKPLTGERLVLVLRSVNVDTLAGQRDAALFLTGFYAALRLS